MPALRRTEPLRARVERHGEGRSEAEQEELAGAHGFERRVGAEDERVDDERGDDDDVLDRGRPCCEREAPAAVLYRGADPGDPVENDLGSEQRE